MGSKDESKTPTRKGRIGNGVAAAVVALGLTVGGVVALNAPSPATAVALTTVSNGTMKAQNLPIYVFQVGSTIRRGLIGGQSLPNVSRLSIQYGTCVKSSGLNNGVPICNNQGGHSFIDYTISRAGTFVVVRTR